MVRPELKRVAAGVWIAALAVGIGPAPSVAQVSLPAPVEQSTLARDSFSTGVLTRQEGAFDPSLWRGADPERLEFLLGSLSARPAVPALGETFRRVLLSPGTAPEGAAPSLGGAKLVALARAGFSEEVRTIASLSNAPVSNPLVSEALAAADLLDGQTERACRRDAAISSGKGEPFWVKLRVLCYAAAGERDAADLTLALLREQQALSETDDGLLTALMTGAAPKEPLPLTTPLHLAAARELGLPLTPDLLIDAEAGVLMAIANDDALDAALRVEAANRAAAMGILSRISLMALYRGMPVDASAASQSAEIALDRAGDPTADVLLFQSIEAMAAPEFLRDKAARIANALAIADTFPRLYAASELYRDDIKTLEGALLPQRDAGKFALARMAIGDGPGAARWLMAMHGGDSVSNLSDEVAKDFIELASLLAILDPVSAAGVAESADVSLESATGVRKSEAPAPDDKHGLASVIEAALDAAIEEIPGQAALAALAASSLTPPGDPIGDVVIGQSLRAARLDALQRQGALQAALRARYGEASGLVREAGDETAPSGADAENDASAASEAGPMPRLKPPVGQ